VKPVRASGSSPAQMSSLSARPMAWGENSSTMFGARTARL
jgi:hypothetical protein